MSDVPARPSRTGCARLASWRSCSATSAAPTLPLRADARLVHVSSGARSTSSPTVSVRPWARIDAMITNDAVSNTSSWWGTAEFSTSRANSMEATPLGPNQAMKSLCGCGSRVPASASRTAAGRATNSAKAMKASSTTAPLSHGRVHDQRSEQEERDRLEDRADVLPELAERLRDVVLGNRHPDAGDEGRDQAVAPGRVGQPVGEQRDAERIDPLVVVRDAAARDTAQGDPGRVGDGELRSAPRPRPSRAAPAPDSTASPPGAASTRKKSTSGSASPSFRPDSRFSV